MIFIKKPEEIELLAQSGKILSVILKKLSASAKKGVTLTSLDLQARELCVSYGVRPAFLGYQPEGADHAYPAAVCLSLNDVVVHGVPTSRTLKDGDILKIDMGVAYKGFITDSATTVAIGKITPKQKRLLEATKKSLEKGIAAAKAGKHIGDIGYAIERVARAYNVRVITGLTGHGVGYEVHEDPIIFNFGRKGAGQEIKNGMVLAIEPMFSLGTEHVIQKTDESYATQDGSTAAHYEHTIAITARGAVVLTA